MFSSRKIKNDIIFTVYKDIRTVFRLNDVAMLVGETNFQTLNKKLNYYVRTSKLQNPRKGIYTKPNYNPEEMACNINTPSYISLEYVLQKAGIVFQYDSRITAVSYLSRTIEVADQTYLFRKIKGEILLNTTGVIRQDNHINIATARADTRSKEVAMRKINGASRQLLVRQFMVESYVLIFLSFILSLVIVVLLMPFYPKIFGNEISLHFMLDWRNFAGLIGLFLGVRLLAG